MPLEMIGWSDGATKGDMVRLDSEQVEQVARGVQQFLGLDHWQIGIRLGENDDLALAHVTLLPDSVRAVITISPSEFAEGDISLPHLERVLWHEFMHIAVGHFAATARQMVLEHVGGPTGEALEQQLANEEERFVDAMSIAFSKGGTS